MNGTPPSLDRLSRARNNRTHGRRNASAVAAAIAYQDRHRAEEGVVGLFPPSPTTRCTLAPKPSLPPAQTQTGRHRFRQSRIHGKSERAACEKERESHSDEIVICCTAFLLSLFRGPSSRMTLLRAVVWLVHQHYQTQYYALFCVVSVRLPALPPYPQTHPLLLAFRFPCCLLPGVVSLAPPLHAARTYPAPRAYPRTPVPNSAGQRRPLLLVRVRDDYLFTNFVYASFNAVARCSSLTFPSSPAAKRDPVAADIIIMMHTQSFPCGSYNATFFRSDWLLTSETSSLSCPLLPDCAGVREREWLSMFDVTHTATVPLLCAGVKFPMVLVSRQSTNRTRIWGIPKFRALCR